MSAIGDGQARPLVSVIIPHYNDLARLKICYERLQAQSWPMDCREIVIADNNSTCGLNAIVKAAPEAVVVAAPIQGAGPARNAGVAASRGKVLAFIDSDCVPERDWIAKGVKALSRYDFVGGKVVTFARDPHKPAPVEAFEQVFNFDFKRYIEKVGFTGSGNMFVRRAVFDRVGGFRATVCEDVDWSFRARQMGFRLGYAPAAIVGHPARSTWMELKQRWRRMIGEDYARACEQRFGRAQFMMKALAMPLSVIPHTAAVIRSPRLPSMAARAGAIRVLIRLRLWRLAEMSQHIFGLNAARPE
jgi:GT2 family glycosyltransferase